MIRAKHILRIRHKQRFLAVLATRMLRFLDRLLHSREIYWHILEPELCSRERTHINKWIRQGYLVIAYPVLHYTEYECSCCNCCKHQPIEIERQLYPIRLRSKLK